ncbi:MAG: methyltransferase domain-containing protein [Bacteroidota bacterium]
MGKTYKSKFYEARHSNTLYSAETIISLIKDLISPRSVVDVGCGVGTWLKVFQDSGIDEILGIEGEWVNTNDLVINKDNFLKTNLEDKLRVDKKYDLAMTLEVAEHISLESADQFVANLVTLAPVILFSAAIPLQGGKHHVNEQWPDYWKEKFAKHNYVIIDCIRPHVWNDEKIEMWYAQNTFVYVEQSKLKEYSRLEKLYTPNPSMLSAVLPRFYEFKLSRFPVFKALKNRIKRFTD